MSATKISDVIEESLKWIDKVASRMQAEAPNDEFHEGLTEIRNEAEVARNNLDIWRKNQ